MKLVLASKNKKKLVELDTILSQLGVEVCSEADAGVDVEVEETGTTFEENSLLKAKAVMEASGLPAVADDSGLCVDALNGAPGVYSARYGGAGAGRHRPLPPAAGEHAGPDAPDGQVRLGHHLLPPQWRCDFRPGGVPRHHRLCPHGGGRLRL